MLLNSYLVLMLNFAFHVAFRINLNFALIFMHNTGSTSKTETLGERRALEKGPFGKRKLLGATGPLHPLQQLLHIPDLLVAGLLAGFNKRAAVLIVQRPFEQVDLFGA